MRKTVVMLCAAAVLTGCRGSREAQSQTASRQTRRVVRVLTDDSLRVTAVVELDEPRLTLRPDSGLRLEARGGRVAVAAGAGRHVEGAREDSTAAERKERHSEAEAEGGSPGRVWVLVACLLLIVLSWIGIRSRR